jgi:hypothetical protein
MAAGATNKKPTQKKKKTNKNHHHHHHHYHEAPLAKQSTRPKRENPLSFSPLSPKNPKNKEKIHKNFTTQKILHTQVSKQNSNSFTEFVVVGVLLGCVCCDCVMG